METANIAIMVADIAAAKDYYTAVLGAEPYVDSPYYVGFRVNGFELGLAGGTPGGPVTYVPVEDVDAAVETARGAGTVVEEPHAVGGGMRVAVIRDTDGNTFGLKASERA